MTLKKISILFIALGILFGTISACLAFLPETTSQLNDKYYNGDTNHEYQKITTNKKLYNADWGTLSMAIISATCFIVASKLIKSDNRN